MIMILIQLNGGRLRWNIAEETHIRIVDLVGIPDIKAYFYRYSLGWMGEPSRSYSAELVHEFYGLYAVLIDFITPTK